MPEYQNLQNEEAFEVGEELPRGVFEEDAFMVHDEDYTEELVVNENEVEEVEVPNFVPGSEEQYIESYTDDSIEVRETNWANDGDHGKFLSYLKDKITKIPRHSGKHIPGCERALAYLKNCDQEISKAMRGDYDGKIDEEEVEKIRKDILNMMDRLDKHIEKLKKNAGVENIRFVSDGDLETNMTKVAGTPVLSVYMTAFERACIGTMINSTVSGGRHIEETYEKLKNKYNFTLREELSLQQLLLDHGYPYLKDRGLLNEPTDPASGNNVDWNTNYYA